MSNNAKIMPYSEFLKTSSINRVRAAIWRWSEIQPKLDQSVRDEFLREGRGAVSLVNNDTGSVHGVSASVNVLVQVFKPEVRNEPHRHSCFAIFIVKKGHGYSVIDGERIDWAEGDVFFAPPWATHEHCNGSDAEDAILYTIQNLPMVLNAAVSFFEQPIGSGAKYITTGE